MTMPSGTRVLVSEEMLALLRAGWSAPVEIMIIDAGGDAEMIARTHACVVDHDCMAAYLGGPAYDVHPEGSCGPACESEHGPG